jgi:S1-C subfamily serine protease
LEIKLNWYRQATFGLTPFSNSLSDRSRLSPEGAGSEFASRADSLAPTESNTSHGPNNPFSESSQDKSVEGMIEDAKKEKLKKLLKLKKLKRLKSKRTAKASTLDSLNPTQAQTLLLSSSAGNFYNEFKKFSQFGMSGDDLPHVDSLPVGNMFDGKEDVDWVTSTFQKIKGSEDVLKDLAKPDDPKESSKKFLLNSTVDVVSSSGEKNDEIAGKAFFIDRDVLLTCYHNIVINGSKATSVTVELNDKEYTCAVAKIDEKLDIAVLKMQESEFSSDFYLKMGDSKEVHVGDEINLIDDPYGYEGVFAAGKITGVSDGFYFISNEIYPGNSGGAVVKKDTIEIVGMMSAGINDRSNEPNAIISVDKIKAFLDRSGVKYE